MANRAYLYFVDDRAEVSGLDRSLGHHERRYFDSRHNVPFAWLLFFDPSDIVLLPKGHGDSAWNEVFLVAPWQAARARFAERQKYLPVWFENRIEAGEADEFLAHVEDFAGKYLVLESDEVMQDEIECERVWRATLSAFQAGTFEPRGEMGDALCLPGILQTVDEQRFRDCIFGITYWARGEPWRPGDDDGWILHRV